MSKIITMEVHPSPEELEAVAQRRAKYESDPALKLLADHIHHKRMMPPPACDQCIQMAMERLAKTK